MQEGGEGTLWAMDGGNSSRRVVLPSFAVPSCFIGRLSSSYMVADTCFIMSTWWLAP